MTKPSLSKQDIEHALIRRELATRSALDYIPYIQTDYIMGWFHHELLTTLDWFITEVEAGNRPRLLIFVPPRHGKSYIISELFPSYLLGRHPEWELIMCTYNQGLASKFGRKVRGRLLDPAYRNIFPGTKLRSDSKAMDFQETTAGGFYKATSIGGQLTGMGYNIGWFDDPLKGREQADSESEREKQWDWWSAEFLTRQYRESGIIGLQTRWHEDDLSGRIIEKEAERWRIISYPALATKVEAHRNIGDALCSDLIPLEQLLDLKKSMLPRDWSALYQQQPTPDEGILFKREWLKSYNPQEVLAYAPSYSAEHSLGVFQ